MQLHYKSRKIIISEHNLPFGLTQKLVRVVKKTFLSLNNCSLFLKRKKRTLFILPFDSQQPHICNTNKRQNCIQVDKTRYKSKHLVS